MTKSESEILKSTKTLSSKRTVDTDITPPNHTMEYQQLWTLFFKLARIYVLFLPSMCSAMDAPKIHLKSKVFVAFVGENLSINYTLKQSANQTGDVLRCFNPRNKTVYNHTFHEMPDQTFQGQLELKNLSITGEYYCKYKNAKVHWFLLVRAEGYKEPRIPHNDKFIIVAIFTGVLLIFSVLGSVYVFRGHWTERLSEHGTADKKEKQSRDKRKGKEIEKDNVDVTAAQSTSFYASLEPRPRSIYDVLDPSPASREQDQNRAIPQTKELPKKVEQKKEHKDEGVFESVYENF